jgi:hypothetical protein
MTLWFAGNALVVIASEFVARSAPVQWRTWTTTKLVVVSWLCLAGALP